MRVRRFIAFILVLVFSLADRTLVLADSGEVPLEKQAPLPVGTIITTQNWQQYKDYMSLGMQILFAGQYAYKLAPDQEVVVGTPTKVVLPREYIKNTEKYSSQVGLKVLPDGGTLIQNYTAGEPFPHLTEPNLGDKILWNLWYRYTPRIEVNHADQTVLIDKYHQAFNQLIFATYMRLGHVSEPGVPIYDPITPMDYAIYAEVTEPEQSKYTVSLLIYFLDPTRLQENWAFVPSLRRPLRLSASARCSPAVGTDLVVEDQKQGFNSLITENTGKVVAHKMTLEMNDMQPPYPSPPIDFFDPNTLHLWGADRGVGWPPASSKWELRDTWVLEVRRVPDKLAGYCFSRKTLYVDATDYRLGGQEQYDMGGKLWKILIPVSRMAPNSYGDWFDTGTTHYIFIAVDLQNVHMTLANQEGPGNGGESNGDVDRQFWDPNRYASPSGLLKIMK